jgi:hypothetical protein
LEVEVEEVFWCRGADWVRDVRRIRTAIGGSPLWKENARPPKGGGGERTSIERGRVTGRERGSPERRPLESSAATPPPPITAGEREGSTAGLRGSEGLRDTQREEMGMEGRGKGGVDRRELKELMNEEVGREVRSVGRGGG